MEPICLCPLNRAERRRIQGLDRKTRDADVRVRCRVVLKVGRGVSRRAAALEVGCAPSTAWRIVERFRVQREASLFDERCDNGGAKVDDDVREGLREILQVTRRLSVLNRVASQAMMLVS